MNDFCEKPVPLTKLRQRQFRNYVCVVVVITELTLPQEGKTGGVCWMV